LLAARVSRAAEAEAPAPPPDFKEVYDLIRSHLAGANETELDRTAVEALVDALSPRVALVTNTSKSTESSGGLPIGKSNLLESGIAYLRLKRVEEGLPAALRQTCAQLSGTNELPGLILDLRFADGNDYAAAAATADIFLTKERLLLDWGKGFVRSKPKSDALRVPIAVLINHETTAAAEALAAVLREAGAALLLGNKTAGEAMMAQEFPLSNGQRLRIATAPVQLGDGSTMSAQGVKPDITVEVSPQDERAYYADAFKELSPSNQLATVGLSITNQGNANTRTNRRPRFNEAELVRERRDGFFPDSDSSSGRQTDTDKPEIQDPVLARALDVLKGIAVVRHRGE